LMYFSLTCDWICCELPLIHCVLVCLFILQKGDFILDRRDSSNYTTFPIWRIDSQRLLQKFEAFQKDDKLLHRALCTVSSRRSLFSIIYILLICCRVTFWMSINFWLLYFPLALKWQLVQYQLSHQLLFNIVITHIIAIQAFAKQRQRLLTN